MTFHCLIAGVYRLRFGALEVIIESFFVVTELSSLTCTDFKMN